MAAHAAPPPVNTVISNQASATYVDASGSSQTVTSNTVQTTVQQIASLTLTANGAQPANPGSVVNYPHTLTNTGNGGDTFNLTASNTAGAFSMTGVQIFADNGSGAPTGSAITSTGLLAANGVFKFIVQGTVPAGATAAQTNTITVTATSTTPGTVPGTKTQSNTDVTTVSLNAVVILSKTASVSSGPAGTIIKYTLGYTNTGNNTATSVAITDVLPAGLTYTAGSAQWSVTGATALSDSGGASGTAPNTLTSGYTLGTKTLLVALNQVIPGQSGSITFNVTVDAGTAPGILNNTATMSYNDGAGNQNANPSTASFNVLQAASVTMTPPAAVASAPAGTVVSFTNVLTNTGNGFDSFNIAVNTLGSTFPSGTTFRLLQSVGGAPLSGGNTGSIAPGTSYNVILEATLPAGATGVGPFTVAKTATSAVDPTKSATAIDTLTAISAASVDATNNLPTGPGVPGAGVFANGEAASVIVPNTVNPGASTTFTIVANNTGLSSDTYDLAASTLGDFSGTLPTGWTVSFKASVAGSCSTTGATITNTNTVTAGGNVIVCAVVSVPAGFAAGTVQLYFRTKSPTSGASDVLHDAVTVNAVRSITISPPSLSGQAPASGSIVYTHTVTNTGNVTEGSTFSGVALAAANTQAGWTSSLFYDSNIPTPNGVLDAGDAAISGNLPTLAPGASITIFNKVVAPANAVASNVTTITVTTSNLSYVTSVPAVVTATDLTSVGNLTLAKAQALDAACDGTPDAAYALAPLGAQPGQCVLYQITVTNGAAASANSVVVSDAVPSYTTLSAVAATTVGTMTANPALNAPAGSTISANVGTLTAGQSAVVTFGVRITP